MTLTLFALALVLRQEPPKPESQEDLATIEKKIAEREARRAPLERRIREAVDRNETEVAQRLNQEFKENEAEIDALKKKRDDIKAARGTFWTDNVRIAGEAMLTRFDKGLDLRNGFGYGGSITLGKHLFFEYQGWQTRDEQGDRPASVQSYQLGLTAEGGVGLEGEVTFAVSAAGGLVHFSSDATRSDSGPVVSLRPEWKYHFNNRSAFTLGGDFDFVWTDFNHPHTHSRVDQSLFLSIELAF